MDEDKIVADMLNKKLKKSSKSSKLVEEIKDLHSAIQRTAQESCSLLHDWTSEEAKIVGSRCRVYWDGDKEWYDARIVTYDSATKRHFLYYAMDDTAEWVDLATEAVCIGTDMVLAKWGAGMWPALRYSVSAAALPLLPFKLDPANAVYVDFMEVEDKHHMAKISLRNVEPLVDLVAASSRRASVSSKLKAAFALTYRELDEVQRCKELIRAELVHHAKATLREGEWVGMRIRTYAAQAAQPQAPPTLASGTVAQFCGGLGEWFVVFDEPGLLPQWKDLVRCAEQEAAFLECEDENADADPACYFTILPPADHTAGEAGPARSDLLVPWLQKRARVLKGEQCDPSTCSLCLRGSTPAAAPAAIDGGSAQDQDQLSVDVRACCRCGVRCHRECMPMSKIGLAEGADAGADWWCWGCAACQGCARPSWERQQYLWNVRRADIPLFSAALEEATREAESVSAAISSQKAKKSAPQVPVGAGSEAHEAALAAVVEATAAVSSSEPMVLAVCAECIYRYKHAKEYCPLCYQLYASVDAPPPAIEDGAAGEPAGEPVVAAEGEGEGAQLGAVAASVEAAAPAAESMETEAVDSPGIDADSMVQCNDCSRWVHAVCEGIDQLQYDAITLGTHPVWGDEYLCPVCRVQVPLRVIKQLKLLDKMELFALPVDESVAPTYFDVIRNPMDLSTISGKASRGMYKSLQALRYDFELMCLNALIFNKVGDEYWLEAKGYYERGCKIFAQLPRKTTLTPLGVELREIIRQCKGAIGADAPSSSSSGGGGALAKGGSKPGAKKKSQDAGGGSSDGGKGRGQKGSGPAAGAGADEIYCLPAKKSHGGSRRSGGSSGASSGASVGGPDADAGVGTVILPSLKSVPNDPKNYCCESVPALIMTAEECVYNCCMDICFVCAAAGAASSAGEMLHCVDCGECFHPFCVGLPAAVGDASSWRCANCKVCRGCNEHISGACGSGPVSKSGAAAAAERLKRRRIGEANTSKQAAVGGGDDEGGPVDSAVLYCDWCDDAVHVRCLQPALCLPPASALSQFSWFCPRCVDCPECAATTLVAAADSSSWGFGRALPCWDCLQAKVSQQLASAGAAEASESCCVCALECCRVHGGGDVTLSSQALPYIHCSRCANVCHVSCHLQPPGALSSLFPIVEGPAGSAVSSAEAYLCPECSCAAAASADVVLPGGEVIETSAAVREQQWRLNDLVGQIGRKQAHMARVELVRDADAVFSMAQASLSAPVSVVCTAGLHGGQLTLAVLYRAIVQWGFLRCFQLQYEIGLGLLTIPVGGVSDFPHIIPDMAEVLSSSALMRNTKDTATTRQQWLRSRAMRFLALWNRPCRSSRQQGAKLYHAATADGCLLRHIAVQCGRVIDLPLEKMHRLLGLDDSGGEFDPRSLMRMASAAAALLHYTNFELKTASQSSAMEPAPNQLVQKELFLLAQGLRKAAAWAEGVRTPQSPPASDEELADGDPGTLVERALDREISLLLNKLFRGMLARPLVRLSEGVGEDDEEEDEREGGCNAVPAAMDVDGGVTGASLAPHSPSAAFARGAPVLHVPLLTTDELLARAIMGLLEARPARDGRLTRNQQLMKTLLQTQTDHSAVRVLPPLPTPARPVRLVPPPRMTLLMSVAARLGVRRGQKEMLTQDDSAPSAALGVVVKSEKKSRKRSLPGPDAAKAPIVSDAASPSSSSASAAAASVAGVDPVAVETESIAASAPTASVAPTKKAVFVAVDVSDPNCAYYSGPVAVSAAGPAAVKSLRGWGGHYEATSAYGAQALCPWVDNRVCCLCGGPELCADLRPAGETPSAHKLLGRLLPYPKADSAALPGRNHGYVHANCIRFSAEVFERAGSLYNTDNARIRNALATDPGSRTKPSACFLCGKRGATVGCNRKTCGRLFHLPCAIACGCSLFETRLSAGPEGDAGAETEFDLYTCMVCPEHAGTRDDPRSRAHAKAKANQLPLSVAALEEAQVLNHGGKQQLPSEPRRRLVVGDFSDSSHRERLATTLSTVKGEKAVRCGACSVLSIGTPRIDSARFHDRYRIFPHYYRSVRLFWSMEHPGARTLYRFEVLTQGDLSGADYDRLLCRPSSKQYSTSTRRAQAFANINRNSSAGAGSNGAGAAEMEVEPAVAVAGAEDATATAAGGEEEVRPVFRAIALDSWKDAGRVPLPAALTAEFISSASAAPYFRSMLSFSIEELYDDIVSAVRRCNKDNWRVASEVTAAADEGSSSTVKDKAAKQSLRTGLRRVQASQLSESVASGREKESSPTVTYGCNAYQFFGLTLPFVRHAIENLIESVASMIVPVNVGANMYPYSPCFKLPTPEAVLRIQQYQADLRSSLATSDSAGGIALLSLSGAARTDVRNIILHNANPSDESTHKTFKVLAKNVSKPGPKKSSITDLSALLRRSNKAGAGDEVDQDRQDDAIFGEDESEYLDWYNIQNSSSSAGFSLTAAQLRIIDRNRRRYSELSNSYEENQTRRLHVQKSHIHGFGLFARTHFSKHEMIVEYIGEKIRQVVADKREQRYEEEGTGSCYLFRLDKEDIIDATKLGGMARFVNHSCCPNAYARVVATDELFKEKHIIIFAGRDILEGEEVTYDYKFPTEEKKLRCDCGGVNCRGSMN